MGGRIAEGVVCVHVSTDMGFIKVPASLLSQRVGAELHSVTESFERRARSGYGCAGLAEAQ